MNFFEHQELARRNSRRLVWLFALAVIAIVVAVNVVVVFLYHGFGAPRAPAAFPGGLIAATTFAVLALIAGGTAYETLALREGGAAVAHMVGGRLVDPSTRDALERRLLNVVEEMALAAGVPMPRVYVLDGQMAINAFAAGFSTSDAVIGVTRGTLMRLSRDELQGVIAHEFSHVVNGDMALNMRLIGVLHGLLVLALAGRFMMEVGGRSGGRSIGSSNDGRGAGAVVAIFAVGIALWLLGYIGVVFGRLIKASVSRQREFLADASSVQFTRNPDGIGGALRKIGGLGGGGGIGARVAAEAASALPEMVGAAHELRAQGLDVDLRTQVGSQISHPHAETLSHLFIAPARMAFAGGWLATHPPLQERIRRVYGRPMEFLAAPLQAAFAPGAEPARGASAELPPLDFVAAAAAAVAPQAAGWGRSGAAAAGGPASSPVSGLVARPQAAELPAAIGELKPAGQAFAQQMAQETRTPLIDAAMTDTLGVQFLVLAMLIDKGRPFSGQQRQLVSETFGVPAAQQVDALYEEVQKTAPGRRLALLDRAAPTLRKLEVIAGERLLMLCHALIAADGRVTLPEFLLFTVLKRRIGRDARRAVPVKYRSVAERGGDAALVLSLVAAVRLPDLPEHAFNAGLLLLPGVDAPRVDAADIRLDQVAAALTRLNQLAPLAKPQLIKACAAAAFVEGSTNWKAASCLRTICAALDAPLPPQVDETPAVDEAAPAPAAVQGELL